MKGIYQFLDQIAANNNRPWFAAHRDAYDDLRDQWLEDLDRLIACMTAWEPAMATQSARSATYRFNRDTRFSPDKSPYKTYFSAALSPFGRKTELAAYYLQVDARNPENGLYGGLYCVEPHILSKLRHAIVDNIEEFEDIINAPDLVSHYPGWLGDHLKTAPKGWPKDHPCIDLLRLRYYGRFQHCTRRYFEDPHWYERAADDFRILRPLIEFLNYSILEDV